MYNYRYLLVFDAARCVPNGDPQTGLQRMVDGRALISQFCLKNKVKKYLALEGCPILHYDLEEAIPIAQKLNLNNRKMKESEKEKIIKESEKEALKYLDTRLFGACDLAGKLQLKLPGIVGVENAMSCDKVNLFNMNLCKGFQVDVKEDGSNHGSGFDIESEIIDYGLFTCFGGTNLQYAERYGFTDDDMEMFFSGLLHMFDNDQAVARPIGSMNVRKLYVWKWEGRRKYSDATLRESIHIALKEGIYMPTCFGDYEIEVEEKENIIFQEINY